MPSHISHSLPPIPISALQHVLFCPRQYALIHIEQLWAENRYTAEGQVLHEKAHNGTGESRPGVRITRGMPVASTEWGLAGVCDVVEFHFEKGQRKVPKKIIPIEYKRGKPKAHRADEVQLCAQAVCLEAMSGITVKEGLLFYGKTRRRQAVNIDEALLELLRECIQTIRELQASGTTPSARYAKEKCEPCSLIEWCQPKVIGKRRGAQQWFDRYLQTFIEIS